MSKIAKYLVFVAVILVLGASVVLWRLYDSFTQTARTDTTIDERQAQSRIEAKDANPGAQRGVGHLETVTEWRDTEEYSPVEMAEHQTWMAAHGYFDNSHYYTYGQLTPEQLDVLVQTGDVGALQFRAFGQAGPDNRQKRQAYFYPELRWGAGKTDKRGMGQGVVQVTGKAVDEIVLTAVGLVGDHHDVAPILRPSKCFEPLP